MDRMEAQMVAREQIGFLEDVSTRLEKSGRFESIELTDDAVLRCKASGAAEDAWYTLAMTGDGMEVALLTLDRWLSESIEADLVHNGDTMEELVEEELVDLGGSGPVPVIKHYRSEQMEYTFSMELPGDLELEDATRWVLAWEAAFNQLGDMSESEQ